MLLSTFVENRHILLSKNVMAQHQIKKMQKGKKKKEIHGFIRDVMQKHLVALPVTISLTWIDEQIYIVSLVAFIISKTKVGGNNIQQTSSPVASIQSLR